MTRSNSWLLAILIAAFTFSPARSLARHGADDLRPQPRPDEKRPEKPGYARRGADDLRPQPRPDEKKPEKPGYSALA